MSPLPNYAAEGRIKQIAAEGGVRPQCLDDVVMRFRDHQFDEAELPAKLKEWRDDPEHHFFVASGKQNTELFIEAFGENPNLSRQGDVVKLLGEKEAAAVAEQFGTKLGTGKPGKTPDTMRTDAGSNASNPFLLLRMSDGVSLNESAAGKAAAKSVAALIAKLGTRKAEAIAKAVGRTITGLALRT